MRSALLAAILLFTGSLIAAPATPPTSFTWSNPGTEGPSWIRDAYILRVGDTYYLTGTSLKTGVNNETAEAWPGFYLWSSTDLKSWKTEGLILSNDDVKWADTKFWAPEIRWHPTRQKFYLCFNARQKSDTTRLRLGMGIAVADKVTGPYKLLTPDEPITDNNDASLFFDDDGRTYVAQSAFALSELDLDHARLIGEKRQILQGGEAGSWDDAKKINEGSTVLKINGTYYYFWSCNSWGYFVGYATAKNIAGPWTKHHGNPIWGASKPAFRTAAKQPADLPFNEVGHGTPFIGPDGRLWIAGHGHWIGEKHPFPYNSPCVCFDPMNFNAATGEFTSALSVTPQTISFDPQSPAVLRAAKEPLGSVLTGFGE